MNKKESKDIFTALDLELNQNPITGPKIIQIGAIVGNIRTGEILEKLSVFINPNQTLEPFIIQLTKIKQEDVNKGVTLEEGYKQLETLHKKYESFINPLIWGQGDVKALKQELGREDLCFGRREIDAKTLYISWRIANMKHPSGGLKKALNNLGLKFQGTSHRADDDALNTFFIYRHLLGFLV